MLKVRRRKMQSVSLSADFEVGGRYKEFQKGEACPFRLVEVISNVEASQTVVIRPVEGGGISLLSYDEANRVLMTVSAYEKFSASLEETEWKVSGHELEMHQQWYATIVPFQDAALIDGMNMSKFIGRAVSFSSRSSRTARYRDDVFRVENPLTGQMEYRVHGIVVRCPARACTPLRLVVATLINKGSSQEAITKWKVTVGVMIKVRDENGRGGLGDYYSALRKKL